MSKNPFSKFQKYVDRPGRSSKDLSYDVNGTYRIGTLYPAGIWEVNAGDSFRIDSAFGIKFLPMPYPIQTRMRANLYYYYVRNRNLMDGWKDFIYNNKKPEEVPVPTFSIPATRRSFWKTGGLFDHLGGPTVLVRSGQSGLVVNSVLGSSDTDLSRGSVDLFPQGSNGGFNYGLVSITSSNSIPINRQFSRPFTHAMAAIPSLPLHVTDPVGLTWQHNLINGNPTVEPAEQSLIAVGYRTGVFYQAPSQDTDISKPYIDFFNCVLPSQANRQNIAVAVYSVDPSLSRSGSSTTLQYDYTYSAVCAGSFVVGAEMTSPAASVARFILGPNVMDCIKSVVAAGRAYFLFIGETLFESSKYESPLVASAYSQLVNTSSNLGNICQMSVEATSDVEIADYPLSNPFAGPDPALPISALSARCYESIYNAYFRNERLEPLMVDGQPEYNKFCPNTANGPDDYDYKLHQRNWEYDFLTSALPTPQQGVAPVVGVTGLSNIQIDDDGTIRTFQAEVSEDGQTIVGGSFTEPGASAGARRTVQEMIMAGFTINDFRNVNALQRWVENNLRRGLKYRDQVMANTGVKVKYDELDMPEFLGGFSRPVNVAAITQTAPGDVGVGDYAGQANVFGENRHSISHYCDEAGFIMAIFCIVPEPVYSQILPKHFLKLNPLDFFHPSFNHIGMQPITLAEVAPLQVYYENPTQSADKPRFNDVFGYQRPWYDLVARVNEAHGLMRTDLKDYIMSRTFSNVPELGGDFVHIDPKQVNEVFSVTLPDQDVAMGQIIHRVYSKNMVSLFGQPKIQ